jgi:hypothetical protein
MSLTTSFSDAELEDISLAFVVANTPRSLWTWLTQYPAVRRVMTFGNLEALEKEWNQLLEETEAQPLRPIAEYAVFAAMVGVYATHGQQLREPKGLRALPWGEDFWGFASTSAVPSSAYVAVTAPEQIYTGRLLENSGFGSKKVVFNGDANNSPSLIKVVSR